ncbi:hypothetical protein EJ08DRAFT_388495 [Tothia fuscella]|uniref:Uncharacterized protein n=1 Tax=Tothia fuscella TaxID=1048955 RepID=A0A9P4P0L0_9PEZI|nr:hypothetical protein EJ08DRAFT_388495 [Tothia fuscella]
MAQIILHCPHPPPPRDIGNHSAGIAVASVQRDRPSRRRMSSCLPAWLAESAKVENLYERWIRKEIPSTKSMKHLTFLISGRWNKLLKKEQSVMSLDIMRTLNENFPRHHESLAKAAGCVSVKDKRPRSQGFFAEIRQGKQPVGQTEKSSRLDKIRSFKWLERKQIKNSRADLEDSAPSLKFHTQRGFQTLKRRLRSEERWKEVRERTQDCGPSSIWAGENSISVHKMFKQIRNHERHCSTYCQRHCR